MGKVTKILGILAGIFVLLLAASVYVGYLALKKFTPSASTSMPAELEKARITDGAGKFEKTSFYADADLGTITELRRHEDSLAIVGARSAVFLDGNKAVQRRVSFPANMQFGPVELVEMPGAAEPFFLGRGSWSTPAMFVDSSGKELWRYGGSPGVDYAAAGDLRGERKIEVVVGMNGGGGILLLDANGNRMWSKPDGNVWHVEILQGGSGIPGRILQSNVGGQLIIRDPNGDILDRHALDMYLSDFSLTRWNGEPEATHVVASDSDTVYVYTQNGQSVARFEAPAPQIYNDIRAVTLTFSNGSTYFAVVRRYRLWGRSILTINSIKGDRGDLEYREILEDACDALSTAPSGDGQALLVGCRGAVFEYDLPRSPPN
ncbi:MAG TPA: hypothetical protein VEJ38_16540 [Candidatus Acidoferrales bacterium]|nr:hypothetical protein [Candidatus Acidoferrales bacterium]